MLIKPRSWALVANSTDAGNGGAKLCRHVIVAGALLWMCAAAAWPNELQATNIPPIQSSDLAPSSPGSSPHILWQGIVGIIAPNRWWSCTLAYAGSVLAWAALSTLLVYQIAMRMRRFAVVAAALGFLGCFSLYVIAWGLPNGLEWIWAICLNVWQGCGSIKTVRKRGGYAYNVSRDGIKDLLRIASSPSRELLFGPEELFHFHEPGTPPVIDPQWCLDAELEFKRNGKLGMLFGRRGKLIFRVAFLEQVLKKKGNQIDDWPGLIKAFSECGYETKKL